MGKQQPTGKKGTPVKAAEQKKVVKKTVKFVPTTKPKEGVATKIMKGPGTAFAKSMGYVMDKAESAGKALRSKIHEATAPTTKKPKK